MARSSEPRRILALRERFGVTACRDGLKGLPRITLENNGKILPQRDRETAFSEQVAEGAELRSNRLWSRSQPGPTRPPLWDEGAALCRHNVRLPPQSFPPQHYLPLPCALSQSHRSGIRDQSAASKSPPLQHPRPFAAARQ